MAFGEVFLFQKAIPLNYESFIESYKNNIGDTKDIYITLETSRGCWWGEKMQCVFCGLNGNTLNHRALSSKDAVDYLQGHINKYSSKIGGIICTDLVLPKTYIEKVIPNIEIPNHLSVFYEVRPTISKEELKILKNKNIKRIQPGIEALYTPTLKLMHKGVNAVNNIRLLKDCKELEMEPFWNIIVGLPNELESSYDFYSKNLHLLFHLPPPNLVRLRFDRYSKYHNNQEKYNLDLHYYDYYEFIYPFDKESLSNTAYFFENYQHSDSKDYLMKWEEELNTLVYDWKKKWSDKMTSKPLLKFLNEESILDTRSGQNNIIKIDVISAKILSLIEKPSKKKAIFEVLKNNSANKLNEAWGFLQENGLIFIEENESCISLVING